MNGYESQMRRLLRLLLATGFIAAGVLHFVRPRAFVRIVPEWLPAPERLVAISGLAEVLGGVGLLVPATRPVARFGLASLLVAVFPANVEMLVHRDRAGGGLPPWLLAARLPVQPLLVAAVLATKEEA
ncbi:MAG: hypothetical protein JWM25_671 [Thermoleophilia bacterium]|nr:hypothetical protein [Thermoleophilia bacterium]MCZ4496088.1 hypothetical protein [Thermoleophilia bacterium]